MRRWRERRRIWREIEQNAEAYAAELEELRDRYEAKQRRLKKAHDDPYKRPR